MAPNRAARGRGRINGLDGETEIKDSVSPEVTLETEQSGVSFEATAEGTDQARFNAVDGSETTEPDAEESEIPYFEQQLGEVTDTTDGGNGGDTEFDHEAGKQFDKPIGVAKKVEPVVYPDIYGTIRYLDDVNEETILIRNGTVKIGDNEPVKFIGSSENIVRMRIKSHQFPSAQFTAPGGFITDFLGGNLITEPSSTFSAEAIEQLRNAQFDKSGGFEYVRDTIPFTPTLVSESVIDSGDKDHLDVLVAKKLPFYRARRSIRVEENGEMVEVESYYDIIHSNFDLENYGESIFLYEGQDFRDDSSSRTEKLEERLDKLAQGFKESHQRSVKGSATIIEDFLIANYERVIDPKGRTLSVRLGQHQDEFGFERTVREEEIVVNEETGEKISIEAGYDLSFREAEDVPLDQIAFLDERDETIKIAREKLNPVVAFVYDALQPKKKFSLKRNGNDEVITLADAKGINNPSQLAGAVTAKIGEYLSLGSEIHGEVRRTFDVGLTEVEDKTKLSFKRIEFEDGSFVLSERKTLVQLVGQKEEVLPSSYIEEQPQVVPDEFFEQPTGYENATLEQRKAAGLEQTVETAVEKNKLLERAQSVISFLAIDKERFKEESREFIGYFRHEFGPDIMKGASNVIDKLELTDRTEKIRKKARDFGSNAYAIGATVLGGIGSFLSKRRKAWDYDGIKLRIPNYSFLRKLKSVEEPVETPTYELGSYSGSTSHPDGEIIDDIVEPVEPESGPIDQKQIDKIETRQPTVAHGGGNGGGRKRLVYGGIAATLALAGIIGYWALQKKPEAPEVEPAPVVVAERPEQQEPVSEPEPVAEDVISEEKAQIIREALQPKPVTLSDKINADVEAGIKHITVTDEEGNTAQDDMVVVYSTENEVMNVFVIDDLGKHSSTNDNYAMIFDANGKFKDKALIVDGFAKLSDYNVAPGENVFVGVLQYPGGKTAGKGSFLASESVTATPKVMTSSTTIDESVEPTNNESFSNVPKQFKLSQDPSGNLVLEKAGIETEKDNSGTYNFGSNVLNMTKDKNGRRIELKNAKPNNRTYEEQGINIIDPPTILDVEDAYKNFVKENDLSSANGLSVSDVYNQIRKDLNVHHMDFNTAGQVCNHIREIMADHNSEAVYAAKQDYEAIAKKNGLEFSPEVITAALADEFVGMSEASIKDKLRQEENLRNNEFSENFQPTHVKAA